MTETKYCGACKCYHPVTEFWRVRKNGTELQGTCKKAMKEAARRYRERVGIEAIREVRRRSAKKCRREPTPEERERTRKFSLAYHHRRKEKAPLKEMASGRVTEAQRRLLRYMNGVLGKHSRQGRFLLRSQFCTVCGNRRFTQGHHPVYGRNHLEDVQWLCTECHYTLHRYERLAVEDGKDRREGLKRFLLEKGCIVQAPNGQVRGLRRSDFRQTSTGSAVTTVTVTTPAPSAPGSESQPPTQTGTEAAENGSAMFPVNPSSPVPATC